MLEVGIDEAGYGPVLGPLVIGLVALRVEDGDEALAARLRGFVVKKPRRLHPTLPVAIDDSKVLKARFGREGLARPLALFAAATDADPPPTLAALLERHSDVPASTFAARPWFADLASVSLPEVPRFPPLADRLRARGVEAVALRVRPVDAPDLNDGFARLGNKAGVLGLATGEALLRLLASSSDEHVRVRFDRHGGRLDYQAYLADLFPFAAITRRPAPRGEARYAVALPDRNLEAHFVTGGDGKHLPIAWASTAAKLVRDLFMDGLNAFFLARAPHVRPTAGYFRDGRRFLDDVSPFLDAEGIDPHHLVRSR